MLLKEAKNILSDHKKDLLRLGVRTLSLFGSVAETRRQLEAILIYSLILMQKKDYLVSWDLKIIWKNFFIAMLIW